MTRKQKGLYLLMLLPLAVAVVALFFLPARFPASMDSQGNVTGWYTKYVLLLLPALSIMMGLFTINLQKRASSMGARGERLALMAYVSGMLAMLVFLLITVYAVYSAFVLSAFIP